MAKPAARVHDRVNETAPSPLARWTYEGPRPFGKSVVEIYTLGNGLRLLFLRDPSAPVVSYFTWFRVGSRHERAGKTGLAHLFEHLMFNETEAFKAGQFDRKLEENGAESNAATWFDWTYYYESLPSERFGLAVDLESERMARLVLRDPQVKSEKEVVANERRMRVDDDVEGAANELLYKIAFTKHPYHWPTIGWMEDIQNFEPKDCEAFYETFYAPNNATIVVVGDVKEADVLKKLRDGYGAIEPSVIPDEDTVPEPTQLEERTLEIKKPTATEKLLIGYKGPALGDTDHAPFSLLSEILFGGRASRLVRNLVIEKELATDLRGWVSTFRDPGLYEVYATARGTHSANDLLAAIDEEFQKLTVDVVSNDELSRAKARFELGLLQSLDTASGKAEQLGFYDTVLGDLATPFRRLEAIRRITGGELRTVARKYLRKESRTVIRILPEVSASEAAE